MKIAVLAMAVSAFGLAAGGVKPGLARFTYARDTFATNFYADVWNATGQSWDVPKEVALPEVKGWHNKNHRSLIMRGLLEVPEDGEYEFKSRNREEVTVAGCRRYMLSPGGGRPVRLAKGLHPLMRAIAPRGRHGPRREGLLWRKAGEGEFREIPAGAFFHTEEDLKAPDIFGGDVKMTLLPGRGAWLSWDLEVPETGIYQINIRRNGALRWGSCCPETTVGFWIDGRHVRHYYGNTDDGGIYDEEPLTVHLEKGRRRLDARGTSAEQYLIQAPRIWIRRLGGADDAAETLCVTHDDTPGESVFRKGEAIEWTVRRSTLDCREALRLRFEAVRQRSGETVFSREIALEPGKGCAAAKVRFPGELDGAFEYAVKDAEGRTLEGPWQFLVIDTELKEDADFAARAEAGECFDDPASFGVKVDEIDFGTEPLGGEHKIRDNGTSRTVDAGGVRYRETGPVRKGARDPKDGKHLAVTDWFGFTLKVKNPGVAHIAAFELPNDKFRRFPVQLIDPQTAHGNGAFYEIMPAAKPGTVRMLVPFWPNEPEIDGLLMPSNTHNDPRSTPGAAAKVTLYECARGFPPLPPAKCGWNPERLAGWGGEQADLSPERTTTPPYRRDGRKVPMAGFRGGVHYDYTAYGMAWQRFGEFSAWQGHNYLRWPIHSYDMAHVQTERLPWGGSLFCGRSDFGRDKYRRNTLKIILLNCEKYGIRFYGDMQVNCNAGWELRRGHTLEGLAAGREGHPANARLVQSIIRAEGVKDLREMEGMFLREHNNLGGNLNPAHPLARRYYANFFGEIAEFCGRLPAFAGMNLRHWGGFSSTYGAWWCSALSGYDDWTMRRYAEETGAEIPPADADLEARHKFLLDDPGRRERWFRWRAEKVTSLKEEILAAMRKHRPDAKLQMTALPENKPFVELGMGLDCTAGGKDTGLGLRTASIRRQGNECNNLDPASLKNFDVREGVEHIKPEDKYGKHNIYPMGLNTGSAMFAPPYATRSWNEETAAGGPLDFADEGVYWAFPAGNAQLRQWIRAFRAIPAGEYEKVPAATADPEAVCWRAGKTACFASLRPWPVEVEPGSAGRDLVTGERFAGKLEIPPYGLRVVETAEPVRSCRKIEKAQELKVVAENPSGRRRMRTVVTLPLDEVALRGGELDNLRLYRRGKELPVQIDPEPVNEVAFMHDFGEGEKSAEFTIRFDRGKRPEFAAPFAVKTREKPGDGRENYHLSIVWGAHEVGLSWSGIGYIGEGGKDLYTGRRTAGNRGWRIFGTMWGDRTGKLHPEQKPRLISCGPVRLLAGYCFGDEEVHWERGHRQKHLYPSLKGSKAWRIYQVRAGGDTMEIVNRYRYRQATGSRVAADLHQEPSWLEPLTPMAGKVVYAATEAGKPAESRWVQKEGAKGVAGTFAPVDSGTWFALIDRGAGCGWGMAVEPAYARYGGMSFGQFLSVRMSNAKIPERGGFDMRMQLRLYAGDPGAERAGADAAEAFAEAPPARILGY